MALPHRKKHSRQAKNTGELRTDFALNPDFGYLNSQVPDQLAFRHFRGAPAGEQTQQELEGFSQKTLTVVNAVCGSASVDTDLKPVIEKIEKENISMRIPLMPVVPINAESKRSHSPSTGLTSKRARVIKTEENIPAVSDSESLRICQLEAEVALLRRQILANQEAVERVIRELRAEWEEARIDCTSVQHRVGGFGVRLHRVEGHVDQIVEHLPAHHGWRSEAGSDDDPDTTLGDFGVDDVEDGSQPVVEWWQVVSP